MQRYQNTPQSVIGRKNNNLPLVDSVLLSQAGQESQTNTAMFW